VADEIVEIPQDLTLVSDDELASLTARADAEWTRLNQLDEITPASLSYQSRLTDDLDRLNAETAARELRARQSAERERARLTEEREALRARTGSTASRAGTETPTGVPSMEDVAAAAARGATAALVAAMGSRGAGTDIEQLTSRATALTVARTTAPQVLPSRRQVITAGVDIPGVARGSELTTLDSVIDAFHRRAKGMPVTANGRGHEELVVTLGNSFEHVVDDRTSSSAMAELLEHLTRPELKESLVAGGGWCAPSEIMYGFFNIAGVDGLIDLPTVGVTRGGIRFPTSPTIADATPGFGGFANTFSNTSNPWIWTEQDDAATVTGSTNKPCVRVPCPTFNEVRLECYGVCLTAGNLTDNAYPELTQHFLRLLLTAHAHAMNARYITSMLALSVSPCVTGGGFAESNDVVTQVLSGIALAATDYRAKYAMNTDSVLEVVAPYWVKEVLRAGFLWRHEEWEDTSVSDGQINQFFADRNVRVQWVNDWQVRASAGQFGNATVMTAWPTSAQIMIYAAGTFVRGNGLTLDLGVVRDSVLNAENDHTAAWSEECHLIARVGPESRCYTITWSVSALVANASTSAPNL
jgi:hypothetical protein